MWNNELFPYIPPDPWWDDQQMKYWAAMMSGATQRHCDMTSRILNGQVEFPTPGVNDHSGNLKVSYVQLIWNGAAPGGAAGPIIQVRHGYGDGQYGQKPRGWFQMANSVATASARIIDQILDSAIPSPIVAGYGTAVVTNSTTITGGGAFLNGWINNGVMVGDEIKLWAPAAGAVTGTTGSVPAGSSTMTLAAAPAVPLKRGFLVRALAGADTLWHRVDDVDSTGQILTVLPSYIQAVPALTNISYWAADQDWRSISAITQAGADVLTLESPGTDVPVGTTAQYVIRRPMDDTYAYFRVLSGDVTETTIAFY